MAETSRTALTSTSSSLHTHTIDRSDETLYQLEVQLQLEQIIYHITHSRNALIRIVSHLLVELRANQSSSSTSSQAQSRVHIPTLADLTAQYINPEMGMGKRKRQMTHYQGIPLCMIHPCPSTSTSTYSTSVLEFGLTRPVRSPKRSGKQFIHVDSRKLHDELNFKFLRIGHGGHGHGQTTSARSSGSFVSSSSSSSSAQTSNSDTVPDMNDNDNDHSGDTDSDDEDDVVLVLHP